jgi:hypothetical protein
MIRGNAHAGINRVIAIVQTGRVVQEMRPNDRSARRTTFARELLKVRTLEFRDE